MPAAESIDYPCPACGFRTFSLPPGSFEICPVCRWEDDNVQFTCQEMASGANDRSLVECQAETIRRLPLHIQVAEGYRRDHGWRPWEKDDAVVNGAQPNKETISPYYWRR
jgi:hypothetical protein